MVATRQSIDARGTLRLTARLDCPAPDDTSCESVSFRHMGIQGGSRIGSKDSVTLPIGR